MGGMDKGLVPYRGRALALYALDALKAHTDLILVNANRNIEAYGKLGYPVVSDPDTDFRGPLSGILVGMQAASTPLILTLPCDMPKVTGEMLSELVKTRALTNAPLVIAHDGQRLQPLLMLAATHLAPSIHDYLASGGRRVDQWVESIPNQVVDLSDWRSALVNFNDLEAFDDPTE